jgi:fumarate reductase subunit D
MALDDIHPHVLAIYFMILSHGMLWDEPSDARTLSDQYYALARAAFATVPIGQSTTLAAVQAIHMMNRYMRDFDRTRTEVRWICKGVSTRLAQAVRAL